MLKALLALLAAGKLGKVLLTGGTMIISVFAYALIYGLWYAVGFVLLIFVHEMGHFLAARQRGLEVGAPTFIPFVGAWIEMKKLPHDVETEAWVGLAGPLLGHHVCGGGVLSGCFFRPSTLGSSASTPKTASAATFQNLSRNAAISANSPSFFAATPPIRAASPNSARWSVAELNSS